MKTFADLIDALGGSLELADALGQPRGTVSAWKTRNSVPAEYWNHLLRLAAERGVEGATHEALAGMVPVRRRPNGSTTAPEAA